MYFHTSYDIFMHAVTFFYIFSTSMYRLRLKLKVKTNISLLPSALARGNIKRDLFSGYTYIRSSAQARTSRRRRLDVYARARIQYRLGTCETRFIAFATLNATFWSSRSFLDRFLTQGEMLHVYVYTCTHAYVEFHVYVYACTHA